LQFLLLIVLNAQIGNNWHFGDNNAMSFTATNNMLAPVQLGRSNLTSDEGCTSMSDKSGNVLFYSNGVKVMNKNNMLMLNGNDLLGNISSFQSSIAIQQPGSINKYYLFTSDAFENNFFNGYRYHIIDMQRDNGNGEVISKNNMLWPRCTERLTMVQHSNGIDVWIITNDNFSKTFRSWLLTCNGLQLTPIVSEVGESLNVFQDMNLGALVVSPDGKKMCQTFFYDATGTNFTPFFQLFDFNASTGLLSNAKKIELGRSAYGCAFSPNSKLLYLTDPNSQSIAQVEATLPTAGAIQNSLVTIPSSYGLFGLQLAPNLKIYVARYNNYMIQINNPNIKGLGCNFTDDSTVAYKNGFCYLNFPQFINNSFFDPYNGFTYSYVDSCNATIQFNAYSNLNGTVNYTWDFGDGQTSTAQNPIHTYVNKNRQYNVTVKIDNNTSCGAPLYKSNLVNAQGVLVNLQFDYTAKCDSNIVSINNLSYTDPTNVKYIWQMGDGTTLNNKNPVYSYATPGTYNITLSIQNINTCFVTPVVKTIQFETITLQAPGNVQINEGESIQLLTSSTGTKFAWKPNIYINDSSLLSPTVAPVITTTYFVTARNNSNCIAKDTVVVTVNNKKEIYIPTAFTPNNDGINDLLEPSFSISLQNIAFNIYNKWGQLVFEGNKQNGYNWNGKFKNKLAPTGTYVYYFNATNILGEKKIRKGTINLLL
jgi:gliding motility-associated-like protein